MLTPTPITKLLMAASLFIVSAATLAEDTQGARKTTSQAISSGFIEREKVGEDMIAICNCINTISFMIPPEPEEEETEPS